MALQLRRAKTDWSGCCQMTVQGALWLAKRLSLNLNFSFLNRISLLLISSSYPIVLTRLGGPRFQTLSFQKKILGYSRESNSGPLGWQSDVLTTIPNKWSQEFRQTRKWFQKQDYKTLMFLFKTLFDGWDTIPSGVGRMSVCCCSHVDECVVLYVESFLWFRWAQFNFLALVVRCLNITFTYQHAH